MMMPDLNGDEVLRVIKSNLELIDGFEVLTASDGEEEGYAKAAAEMPDVILMDLELPIVDGWEATRRLKRDPATQKHPDHRAHRARHGRCARASAGRGVR